MDDEATTGERGEPAGRVSVPGGEGEGPGADSRLAAVLDLSRHHREDEKYYARSPLEHAIELQRAARALTTLADRWGEMAAPQADGALFLAREGQPVELARLTRDLGALADDCAATGAWLAEAMEASWEATATLRHPGLADLLGERHRIIANDWQAAGLSTMVSRMTLRAIDLLAPLDLSSEGVRSDLAGPRVLPRYLHSAAELLDRAADLASESAGLVRDNERRWRVLRSRVEAIVSERGAEAVS